jgi:hypothetical protein
MATAGLIDHDARGTAIKNSSAGTLVLCVFVAPFVLESLGYLSPAQAGGEVAVALMYLFLIAVVAWLIARKGTASKKAGARLGAALMLVILITPHYGKAVAAGDSREQDKKLMTDFVAWQEREQVPFVELGHKFEQVDIEKVLTPTNLTTSAGMASARTTMTHYRALLAERNAVIGKYLSDLDQFVAAIPPGPNHDQAAASASSGRGDTVALYGGLDKAQSSQADAMTAMLDWADAQGGSLKMRDNQLLFANAKQQSELQTLLAQVTAADENVAAVNASIAKTQAAAKKTYDSAMDEAKAISK